MSINLIGALIGAGASVPSADMRVHDSFEIASIAGSLLFSAEDGIGLTVASMRSDEDNVC